MKTILKLFLPCVLAHILWVSPLRAQTPAITGYDIILIAGQSNAGHYGLYPSNTTREHPNVLEYACPYIQPPLSTHIPHECALTERTLRPATDMLLPRQRNTTRVSFALSFGQAYAAQNPGRKVVLVPTAVGSTTLLPYWDEEKNVFEPAGWAKTPAGSGAPRYANAVAATLKAIEVATDQRQGDVRLAAILWAQGESDIKNILCGDSVHSSVAPPPSGCTQLKLSAYKDELRKVIQGFRSDLPRSTGGEVPFLAVGASPSWVKSLKDAHDANPSNPPRPLFDRMQWYKKWDAVHEAYIQSASELPAVRFINTLGRSSDLRSNGDVCAALATACLDTPGDLIHYSADSQQRLGRELAEQVALLNKLAVRLLPRTGVNGTEWVNGVDGQIATRHGQIELASNGALDFKNRLGELKVVLPANTFIGSYTKMAWIKPRFDSSDRADSHIMSSTEPGQSHYFYYNQARKELAASQAKDGSRVAQVVASGIPANEWTHVATVYNESTKRTKLFVNGQLVAESPSEVLPLGAPNSHASTVDVVVGGVGNWADRMNGIIHQPHMYRRAWSDWQIKQEFGRIARPAD